MKTRAVVLARLCFALFFLASAHTALATVTTTFTTTGTWTAPAGVTSVTAEAWGGGGGGAGSGTAGNGGGGGAAGAYAKSVVTVTPGNSYTVVVGAAGAGGVSGNNNGSDGTSSMFFSSTTVLATGGGGGSFGASGAGGATTSGSVGSTTFQGGNGGAGVSGVSTGAGGGAGGSTQAGTAASTKFNGVGGSVGGGDGAPGVASGAGLTATSTGGGGSGGLRSGGSVAGGAGFRGQVQLTYTLPPPTSLITQEGYIFENDDATTTGDTNSQQAAGSTTITGVKKGERMTVRFHIKNTGGAASSTYGLFYDQNDGIFTKVRANAVATTSAGTGCANTNWDCSAADTGGDVGQYSSLAFDALGTPWVSYYLAATSSCNALTCNIIVAHLISTSTGSGLGSVWATTTIDSANDVGVYHTSIAFATGSTSPWVSYYDATNFDLRVAEYVGSGGTGCASSAWTCTAVDTTNVIGTYSSIAFATGSTTPWVSYYSQSNGNLVVARYVGSGGTGCASTAWTCTLVDTANDVGWYTSIAFDPSGNPWVSYYDTTIFDLRVAEYVGSGGTGCASTAWTCTVVDTASMSVWYTSLAFDPSGKPWISYYDGTNQDLRVVQYVGSGGTGCASTAWTCTSVDTAGSVGSYTSLAFDPSGNPWVSYQDGDKGNLRVAYYVGTNGTGCALSTWTCTAVDTVAGAGQYTSLAFDPSGNPWVSSYASTTGDLRIAHLRRSGEITVSPSVGIGFGTSTWITSTTTFKSHADMLSTTDATNRADADCLTSGATWNNGWWYDAEEGTSTFPAGNGTPQCTELAFTIDTSQAINGRTYRLVLATKDGRMDKSLWRGPISGASSTFPTLTIESATSSARISKDTEYQLPPCAPAGWGCGTMVGSNTIGQYSSIAFDPSGNPWVSYYAAATSSCNAVSCDLYVARYVGSGGTGASSTAWTVTAVDTTNDVGSYSSIAFDALGTPWISYYAGVATSTCFSGGCDLRVAHYVGSGGTGCASSAWTCTSVDTTNDVGKHSSIAFDPSGNPWISYYDATGADLRVAQYVGSGGTGCASTAWTCTAVDTTNNVGLYSSLAFDASGNPWVSYQVGFAIFDLRVAHYVGSSTPTMACSGSSAWTCTTVDVTNNVGTYSSIAFNASGNPWVSYYDATNLDLRVAQYVGSGGTGCADAAWTCTAVDTANTVGSYTTIAFDTSGNPWVSYYDATNLDLRVAQYVGSGGAGCASSAWTCTAVDTANDVGLYTSLAFDPSGTPWVSEYDNTNFDLRIAKLNLPPTKLSLNAKIAYPGRSAGHGDLRYRLDIGKSPRTDPDGTCSSNTDKKGYCGVQSNDSNYESITGQASTSPMYAGAFRNGNNTDNINVTWIGQSNVTPSSNHIRMQVYRFGTTNAWFDLASTTDTCAAGSANTDCTIVGATTTNLSEYYDQDGSDYWTYIRVYQAENDTVAVTLKTNQFATSSASGPNQTLFHYRWRWDNGTEAAATFFASEDTAIPATSSLYRGDRLRLRFVVSNAGSSDAANITYRLEYASSSCSTFYAVPAWNTQTWEEWVMDLSGWVPDGAATTNNAGLTDPGGKSFVAGQVRVNANQTSALTLTSSQFTELEYSLRSTLQAQKNLLYCFRLTNAGSITNFTYTVQPQASLNPNPRPEFGGMGSEPTGSGSGVMGGSSGGGSGSEGSGSGTGVTGGGAGGGGGDSGMLTPGLNQFRFAIASIVWHFASHIPAANDPRFALLGRAFSRY